MSEQPMKLDMSMIMQDQSAKINPKNIDPYVFLKDSYEGTGGYETGTYLVPNPREAFYNSRRASSVYKNIFRQIIDAQVNPVFADDISRETDSDLFQVFIDNSDNCGTSIQDMVESAIYKAKTYDLCFIVMDNAESQAQTLAQAVETRSIPYIYIKEPQEVYTFSTNRWGQLTEISFTDEAIKIDDKNVQTYRSWTSMDWKQYYINPKDNKGEITVAEGTHGLGVLPVIPCMTFARVKALKTFPRPTNIDLAYMVWHLYNKESQVNILEQSQCFSIFYTSGLNQPEVVIGPQNFVDCSPDSKFAPGFASPDFNHLKNLVANCDRLIDDVHNLASQRGVLGVRGSETAKSGKAIEWEFNAEESVLKKTSQAALHLEMSIAELFKKYTNTTFDYTADYPVRFSPDYNSSQLADVTTMINGKIAPPKPLLDRLWRRTAILLFGDDTQSGDTLIKELDSYAKTEQPEPAPLAPIVTPPAPGST